MKNLSIALLLWLSVASMAAAEIRLPSVLSSHMVLQRDCEATLWGTAEPAEKIVVKLDDKQVSSEADSDGQWTVKLPPTPAGGPHKIVIEDAAGDNRVTLVDVLFGEVWICSGQSNMELPMAQTDRAKEDIAAADNPQLRLFTVSRTRADQPADECKGRWSLCTPPAVTSFSATAYFFGADVQRALGVPVGLVHTSWGGTPAEAWTPRPVLESRPTLKQLAQGGAQLYNGMIAPLTRMAVAGAIWYQGEANVGRAIQYRTLFPTMIGAWREAWHREALPFYFVQIAPYRYHIENGRACAQLWEAQLETMKTLPHTGMAVINDSKSVGDIHPRNKRIAGERLARWALAKTYGKTDVVYSGPIFKSAQPEVQVDADKIRIAFDSIGAGLASRDGKPLTYFTIAGADQNFVPATAVIEGDNVLVHSDRITKPVAVRFAWHEDAEPNLINKEGLPASPFRTDDWNLTSEAKRSIAEPPKSP